jgi:ATP-binding cassette, subfamily B, bacterial
LPRRPRVQAHELPWRASKPLTLLLAGLILIGGLSAPLYALATGGLIGSVARHASPTGWLVVLAGLYVVSQLQGPAQEFVAVVLVRKIDDDLRSRMIQAMLGPNGVAHLEDPELQDKLELARGVAWGITPGFVAQALSQLWLARLGALGSLLLVARFRWWLALLLLASNLVTLRSKRQSFQSLTQMYQSGAQQLRKSGYFREVALGTEAAKETRVFGLGPWAVDKFDAAWLETMRRVWKQRTRGALLVLAGLALQGVTTIGALLYIANAGLDAQLPLPRFVVVVQAMMGVASLSMILGNPEIYLEQGTASMLPAFDLEAAIAGHPAQAVRGTRDADGLPRQSIRFENVSFAYPGRDDLVLDGLDLEIPAGKSLALVGDNGAGKTTLVKLLARLYDPTDGVITVDGVALRDIDPEAWHARLGAIFQDFGQYALTASDNVGLGALDEAPDIETLDRVAEQVGIAELVHGWENQWDSILSRQYENGVEVSGGQWQRIALARALFAVERGAGVLVLDEPTAQLDVRGEAELYDRFLELTAGRTTIVISHRFSTVRRADRIVVLEHGRIREAGSHDELVAQGGKYAEMFNLQAARFVG